jgi:prefoldin subunit 5
MNLNEAWEFVEKYSDSIPYAYEAEDIDELYEVTERYGEMLEHLLSVERLTKLPYLEDKYFVIQKKQKYFGVFSPESQEQYNRLTAELEEIQAEMDNIRESLEIEEF